MTPTSSSGRGGPLGSGFARGLPSQRLFFAPDPVGQGGSAQNCAEGGGRPQPERERKHEELDGDGDVVGMSEEPVRAALRLNRCCLIRCPCTAPRPLNDKS